MFQCESSATPPRLTQVILTEKGFIWQNPYPAISFHFQTPPPPKSQFCHDYTLRFCHKIFLSYIPRHCAQHNVVGGAVSESES